MAMTKKEDVAVEILRIEQTKLTAYLLGTTPLIMNRMTAKARQQILLPERRLNKAALEARQKHNPPMEYKDSVYLCRDSNAPTLVHFPTNAFKKAMAQAAIDIPGAKKAEIGRWVQVKQEQTVHIYGVPQLSMMVVRQAGIAKTPDIRTRAIFPKWACKLEISYIRNNLRETDIVNLLAAAGNMVGVGDGRTEKGTFDFGNWDLVAANDPEWLRVVKNGGRKPQEHALANPVAYDEDTEELFSWYGEAVISRELDKKTRTIVRATRNGKEARAQ